MIKFLKTLPPEKIYRILLWSAFVLNALNVLFFFLPSYKMYLPSKSLTIMGETQYLEWHTEKYSFLYLLEYSAEFYGLILLVIPFVIDFFIALRNVLSKDFKRFRGIWGRTACFFKAILILFFASIFATDIERYEAYGAYGSFTFFGACDIVCVILLFALTIVFSRFSKYMVEKALEDKIRKRVEMQLASDHLES